MSHYLFTSESVAIGHPDKVADQISDAILDEALRQDPDSRVACEVLVSTGLVVIAGEVTTKAQLSYRDVARRAIQKIGYDDCSLGFDFRSCGIIETINRQSPDIAQGVDSSEEKALGAGDQGIMFGYACEETKELMPLPIMLSHWTVQKLKEKREKKILPYLCPDAKAQYTVEYDEQDRPVRLHSVVLSTQHKPIVSKHDLESDMIALIKEICPSGLIDEKTVFYINPTGQFLVGGPVADCGLTGRKIIVDTYGGRARHGGGAFSGKDATKVDRSGAYAARYVAKNIVAAGVARRCEIQLSYAIGISHPIAIKIDTFGTSTVDERLLEKAIPLVFDLSAQGIIDTLDLKRPIFSLTAFGGHFGRAEPEFTWEKTDKTEKLLQVIKQETFSLY
jgi:S-adenosylmethionine synthetase